MASVYPKNFRNTGLVGFAEVAHNLGRYDEARQLCEESLAIGRAAGDRIGIANSLLQLGLTSWVQGQFEEAERLSRESLAIHQEIGDRGGIARALERFGESLVRFGRFAEGYSLMEESLAICDDLGLGYRQLYAFTSAVLYKPELSACPSADRSRI